MSIQVAKYSYVINTTDEYPLKKHCMEPKRLKLKRILEVI